MYWTRSQITERSCIISISSKKRPIIAIVADQLSSHEKPIVASLHQQLSQLGYGVLYVCGGTLKPSTDSGGQAPGSPSAIYALSKSFPVAGYIVLTNTICNQVGQKELIPFIHQFTHKPIVSIGCTIPDLSCVHLDNYTLMTDLMAHMTSDPSRQRFVFIRGFTNCPGAQAQEAAFRDMLMQRQIPVDESLIINGNNKGIDAYYALDELLTQTHDIHAVVAASDDMAASAIYACRKHNLRIPEDIIVSGFDNNPEAASCVPPLTSVRCSMDTTAELIIESLLAQVQSGLFSGPEKQTVHPPAKLVIRASTEPAFKPARSLMAQQDTFDAAEFRESMLHNLNSLNTPEGLDTETVISDVVSMLVNGAHYGGTHLHNALLKAHDRPEDIYWWRHLHQQITANLQLHGSEGQSSHALPQTVSILGQIHETIWSVENALYVENARQQQRITMIKSRLNEVKTLAEMLNLMKVFSSHCGVNAWCICVYQHPSDQPEEMASILYQSPDNFLDHDLEKSFPSADVLPGDYLQSESSDLLMLVPLCTGNSHLGYMVVAMDKEQYSGRMNLTSMADYIASTLWRVLANQKLSA